MLKIFLKFLKFLRIFLASMLNVISPIIIIH